MKQISIAGGQAAAATSWGVDSEYGVLRRALLGPPDHLRWLRSSPIAEATHASGATLDRERALRQHGDLVEMLSGAGVEVSLLPADPALPYQAYARDSSIMTPFGAVIAQMDRPWRRGEWAPAVRFYQEEGIPILGAITAGGLEGGDVELIRPGTALIGYTDDRSTEAGAEQLAGWLRAEGWEVRLERLAPYFVHLDALVTMAADGLALVAEDVVSDDLVRWLRGLGIEIVPVSYRETMALGCNVLSLGGGRLVSPESSGELNARLRSLGLDVLDPPLDMFTAIGGSIHCLCQPLCREPG